VVGPRLANGRPAVNIKSLPNTLSFRSRAAIAVGILAVAALPAQAALTVTTSSTAATLVNSILGPGITVVPGSQTYSGANLGASGFFAGGNSVGGGGLGIDTGLILTTGNAVGAIGPNNTGSYSGSGAATTLSFNFNTAGGDLFFNYVFASEEYNEYVGSGFNDTFTFKVDGTNIALIPSTSTPVTINNVNLGSNSAFYRNNSPGPFTGLQYDGLTTVLQAKALGLSAGTHHIDLFITDVGDSSYDSAVFIQGGSFADHPTGTTPDSGSTVGLLGLGLAGLAYIRRRRIA
jgi:hypothetical protein